MSEKPVKNYNKKTNENEQREHNIVNNESCTENISNPIVTVEQNENYESKEEIKIDDWFLVRVDIDDLNIRKGPGKNYDRTGKYTGKGMVAICEVKDGIGSIEGWGRLRSGEGWISLEYATRA